MSLPITYHEMHGCHDCYFVFCKGDYDDGPYLYCRRNAPKRPLCGSVAMNENFFPRRRTSSRRDIGSKNIDAWHKWSENREVKSYGKCDHWILMKARIEK